MVSLTKSSTFNSEENQQDWSDEAEIRRLNASTGLGMALFDEVTDETSLNDEMREMLHGPS